MKIDRENYCTGNTPCARAGKTGYNRPRVCTGTPGRRYTAADGAVSRTSSLTPLAQSRQFFKRFFGTVAKWLPFAACSYAHALNVSRSEYVNILYYDVIYGNIIHEKSYMKNTHLRIHH